MVVFCCFDFLEIFREQEIADKWMEKRALKKKLAAANPKKLATTTGA
jgi:hypothetical protein